MNERFARAETIARVDLAHEPDFAIGDTHIRPTRREIAGKDCSETIEPLVMKVLVALARAKGGVVSRDDLIESCWDGVIVGEDAINRCIRRIRRAAEATGSGFWIETVPRIGYRLKAAGLASQEPATPIVSSESPPAAAAADASPRTASRSAVPIRWAIVPALISVFAILGLGWQLTRPPEAPLGPPASVAVLPFLNLSGDAKQEYFSDGFSEELLNELSNNPHLRVAARTSSFAFKGKNEDTADIARALHVRAIVEGSIRESGNRVRINAQMIDAEHGYNIWSARYDRSLADVLSVQDEIARAIAMSLTHTLARTPSRPKINPAVYKLYLQARYQTGHVSPEGFRKALEILKEVTVREPTFAEGFLALANAALDASEYDAIHYNADLTIATAAAQQALVLDPRNIRARLMRGLLELPSWNWRVASIYLRGFHVWDTNNTDVLRALRVYYNFMGFPDEAIAAIRKVVTLDPISDSPKIQLLYDLLNQQYATQAIVVAQAVLAHKPDHPMPLHALCVSYASLHRMKDAYGAEQRLRRLKTSQQAQMGLEDCQFEISVAIHNFSGARKLIDKWAAGFPDALPSATGIAEDYVEVGDFDKASDWYERAYERREFEFFRSISGPGRAKYRSTPRWKTLMQRAAFREWQAEHDRIAAELKAHGGPL